MAVLLHSPEEYRSHIEEAFGRANVPVYFARGAVRPDPAGRAFLPYSPAPPKIFRRDGSLNIFR